MARLPFCSWRRTPLNEITHTAYKEIALHLSWHEMSAEEAWYRVSSFIQCAKISVGLTCCASGTVAVKCPLETVFRSFFQPLLHLYRMLLAALPLFQSLLNSKETEMNVREKKNLLIGLIVVLSISGKKFKKLTDLFLQTLTHGTVHIVTCAKELQNIVLIVKANKVLHNFISMHVNHREIVTFGDWLTSLWHCLSWLISSLHSSVWRWGDRSGCILS